MVLRPVRTDNRHAPAEESIMPLSRVSVCTCLILALGGTTSQASEVRVWGDTTTARPEVFLVPAGLNNAVAVAATASNVTILRDNGSVIAWGDNSAGQCNIPAAAMSGVTAIASGPGFNFALKYDGSLVAWGQNAQHVLNIPTGLPAVRSIHVQPGFVIVVLTDNTLRMWGDFVYMPPTGLVAVEAYPMTLNGGVALKADGTVTQWIDPNGLPFANVPNGLIATSLTNNWSSSVAISGGGTVTQWGYNTNNEANIPGGLTNVVEVAIGAGHTIARKTDGTLVTWGTDASILGITPSPLWTNAVALSGGRSFTAGIFSVGNAPSTISLSPQTVNYGTIAGTTIGTLSAIDTDLGSTFTYEFNEGAGSTDNALFLISGNSLVTASTITPTLDTLSIRILARDGNGNSKAAVFPIMVSHDDSGKKKCGLGGSGIVLVGGLLFGWMRRRSLKEI